MSKTPIKVYSEKEVFKGDECMDTSNFYSLYVDCKNCSFYGKVWINKGYLLTESLCSNCECPTLNKLTKTNMNQEDKEVKSNEVCYLCLHQECVCKEATYTSEEWVKNEKEISKCDVCCWERENPHRCASCCKCSSPFIPQSLEEKCEACDAQGSFGIIPLESHTCNKLPYPPTDSNWRESLEKVIRESYVILDSQGNGFEDIVPVIENLIQSEREFEREKCRNIFINSVDWAEWGMSDEDASKKFDEDYLSSNKPSNE